MKVCVDGLGIVTLGQPDKRKAGETVPAIIKRTGFSKASVYRALA